MYGEMFDVSGRNGDGVITKFIAERVLCNSEIAKSFTHPTVSHSFRPGRRFYKQTIVYCIETCIPPIQ